MTTGPVHSWRFSQHNIVGGVCREEGKQQGTEHIEVREDNRLDEAIHWSQHSPVYTSAHLVTPLAKFQAESQIFEIVIQ